jgi:hypothetical protein
METIIKWYEEQFGHTPSIYDLRNLYTQGVLNLSDDEENSLINAIDKEINIK